MCEPFSTNLPAIYCYNKAVYQFTGAMQTLNVWPSVNKLCVKLWGAGGGSANNGCASANSFPGPAGGPGNLILNFTN